MTIQDFIAEMNGIIAIAEQGLKTAETYIPNSEIDAGINIAELVLPIVGQLVSKALNAWSNASGQPITVETITALLPDATPLTPPVD